MYPQQLKIAFVSSLATAYVHRLLRGALSYAETQPRMMIREFHVPRTMRKKSKERDPVGGLLSWQPDGMLTFLEEEELAQCLTLLDKPCPVVSMCHVQSRKGVVMVCGSFAAEAKMAVNHFREQGLRSIVMLMLGGPDPQREQAFIKLVKSSTTVRAVFLSAVAADLLDDQECNVEPVPSAIVKWFRELPLPSGVFCPEIGSGGYVIRVCRALGLRVPEDISVIGSDDADVSLSSRPTLSSVIPVGEKIGSEAARILSLMIAGKPPQQTVVRFDAMDLRVRQSTGLQRSLLCDIAGAVDYITQYACSGLKVEELLKATQHVSYKTFHTHFKIATGRTPGEAILHRQFEEARRLLTGSLLNVTMIAEKCGFGSSSDFSRRFRAIEGMSPTEYRRQSSTR